jgi:hypothetical protein
MRPLQQDTQSQMMAIAIAVALTHQGFGAIVLAFHKAMRETCREISQTNSKGTTIPCAWSASSPVLCWMGITCSPVDLVMLFLPSTTKDKLLSQFSPFFGPLNISQSTVT